MYRIRFCYTVALGRLHPIQRAQRIRHRERLLGFMQTFRRAINHTLLYHRCARGTEVEVLICTMRDIQKLNCARRGKNQATDALAFSNLPCVGVDKDLGVIVVSPSYIARRCWKRSPPTFRSRASAVALHASLHLLGYDHEEVDQWKVMTRLEKALYRTL